jgi:hypothetical protein
VAAPRRRHYAFGFRKLNGFQFEIDTEYAVFPALLQAHDGIG